MKLSFLAVLAIALLTRCNNSPKPSEKEDQQESTAEVDTQNMQSPTSPPCVFSNPDTSVAGMGLRNSASTLSVIGKQAKLEGGAPQAYYSGDKKQQLILIVHPGDNANEIGVFAVSYAESSKQNYSSLKSTSFQTESGIMLGMSKSQVIEKLGRCYEARDSTAAYIVLQYNLITPNDSKTKILARHNMPMYYATYSFKNDLLESFEFGFENP